MSPLRPLISSTLFFDRFEVSMYNIIILYICESPSYFFVFFSFPPFDVLLLLWKILFVLFKCLCIYVFTRIISINGNGGVM